jgi:hypothetical protein
MSKSILFHDPKAIELTSTQIFQIPTDPAAELDQNSEHVDSPHDLDIGIPRGIDASIDEHISDAGQDENGDTPRTKETEMINITYDKGTPCLFNS